MPVVINGSTGISGVDGSAGTPAFQGSDTNTGIRFGTDIVSLVTGGSDRLYIDSSGRLGVGTSSPSYALDVISVSGSSIASRFRGNASGNNNTQIRFYGNNAATDQWAIGGSIATNDTGRDFHIYDIVAGQNRLAINSSGFVGIGSTAPACALMVAPQGSVLSGTGNNYAFYINPTSTGYVYLDALTGSTNNTSLVLRTYNNGTYNNLIQSISGNETTFSTAGTERARIDSSGRLLVGTSTARGDFFNTSNRGPSLQVEGTTTNTSGISVTSNQNNDNGPEFNFGKSRGTNTGSSTIVSSGDGLGRISFQGTDGSELVPAAYIEATVDGTPGTNDMPGRLVFSVTTDGASSPTERMRLEHPGTLNLFSASAGNVTTLVTRTQGGAGTSIALIAGVYNGTGTVSGGTTSFVVYSNGNVVNTNSSYGALSDIKLKENIVDASSQWEDIKALKVRKYNFKEGQTHTQIGVIAQEVEQVSPGLVTESPDKDEEGSELGTVTKSVQYSVLYMKAVKALQEAMERIEQLEAKVAALESA